jgi:hypothetical protein
MRTNVIYSPADKWFSFYSMFFHAHVFPCVYWPFHRKYLTQAIMRMSSSLMACVAALALCAAVVSAEFAFAPARVDAPVELPGPVYVPSSTMLRAQLQGPSPTDILSAIFKALGVTGVDPATCVADIGTVNKQMQDFVVALSAKQYKAALDGLAGAIGGLAVSVHGCGVQQVQVWGWCAHCILDCLRHSSLSCHRQ